MMQSGRLAPPLSHLGTAGIGAHTLANPGCRRPQPVWPLTSRASCVAQQVPHRFGTAANATPSLVPHMPER